MFVYFAKVVKNLAVLLTKIVKKLKFLALFVIFTPLILLLGIYKVKAVERLLKFDKESAGKYRYNPSQGGNTGGNNGGTEYNEGD